MADLVGGRNISQTEVTHGDVFSISDEVLCIFTWVIFGVVCQLIDIFGIVTNIINIICFIEQGFKDSINISLLALSISDLSCLVTLIVTNMCFTPAVNAADLTFDPGEVSYLVAAIPHLTFTRVTSWITALITLERCLCVIAPLKVKSIITPGRVTVIMVCVFILLLSSVAPVYVVNKLGMKFSPLKNKTLFGLVYMEGKEKVEMITFAINSFILPFIAFIIIVVCTIILVVKLKSSTKWRTKSANQAQGEHISNRGKKVSKMVVMISGLFIACFVPISTSMLALALEPELSFNGRYVNLSIMLGGLCFALESINSSLNFFIYYHMSSNYRDAYQNMISKLTRTKQCNY